MKNMLVSSQPYMCIHNDECNLSKVSLLHALTLYDPGGGGLPFRFIAVTHFILELHYSALVTFPKK